MDSWIVSHKCDGCSTRSQSPASTRAALSFITASSAHLVTFSGRDKRVTYSQPPPAGAKLAFRGWKSELSAETAVTFTDGNIRRNVCWITEPSVVAVSLLSRTDSMLEVTNRVPLIFSASELVLKRSSAFASMG